MRSVRISTQSAPHKKTPRPDQVQVHSEKLRQLLIDMVPQWYLAEKGPHWRTLGFGADTTLFRCHRRPTPELQMLLGFINTNIPGFLKLTERATESVVPLIEETVALKWLSIHCDSIDWQALLNYLSSLLSRTYENAPVGINVVIGTDSGSIDLGEPSIAKFMDPLAMSPFTFLECDKSLRIVGYREVSWDEVQTSSTYSFHPDFLHPIFCKLQSYDDKVFSVHLTSNRDVIIMDRGGIVASQRKGHWKLYDQATFKNSLVDVMGNYYVGANLVGAMLDLSYRRHGALMIYDPSHSVLANVLNDEAKANAPSSNRSVITNALSGVQFGKTLGTGCRHRRLLSELASIDGAVLFDAQSVLAVGAVIKTHPEAGDCIGARTTAAKSAFKWGGKPMKISSDGDVTIHFASGNDDDGYCDAELTFT